jgi:hypothetical protein
MSLAFLGRVEVPMDNIENRLPDLWPLSNSPAVPLLAKTQELPASQLPRPVDLFHLVITDNLRPGTLSLPHCLACPMMPTTHSSQAARLWTLSAGLRETDLQFGP